MWMMGCHEADSFNGRKLRPLVPRPVNAAPPPCMMTHRIESPEAASVVVSSRWNPTAEQLRTLEELYRRGTRTPSAEQIQHITAQLRRFGKIEGKNVFYWFQNHKARERQKRRRQMECSPTNKDNSCLGGSSRVAGVEAEQNKNCSTHCATTPPDPEEENSRATKAATGISKCAIDHGWDRYELQQRQQQNMTTIESRRNATWHSMQLPCALPRVITSSSPPTVLSAKRFVNGARHDYLNIFIHNNNVDSNDDDQDQTLELFPLRSENATVPTTCTDQKLSSFNPTHNQFFEFLPLKN